MCRRIMTAYVQHDPSFVSRRTTVVLLIVCLHGVLIYFLATGLAHKMAAVIPPLMQVGVLDKVPEHRQPPPPPQPTLAPTRLEVPEPDLTVDVPPDGNTIRDPVIQESPPSPPKATRSASGSSSGINPAPLRLRRGGTPPSRCRSRVQAARAHRAGLCGRPRHSAGVQRKRGDSPACVGQSRLPGRGSRV